MSVYKQNIGRRRTRGKNLWVCSLFTTCCCQTGASIGMPDLHSGYGFAIGNVAAVDMDNPQAVVSPGGVGFDINCGVRGS